MHLTPWVINNIPVDSWTPRITALGVCLLIQVMAPLIPMMTKIIAINKVAAMICWLSRAVATA